MSPLGSSRRASPGQLCGPRLWAFWLYNGGLVLWIVLNFFPIGWPQLDAVYEHGLAYARSSAAFILHLLLAPALRMLERLRAPRMLATVLLIGLLFGEIVASAEPWRSVDVKSMFFFLSRKVLSVLTRSRTRRWNSGSAWLRPRIAPLAIMMAGAAGALAGRVFRLGWGGIVPSARNGRRRAVQRRAFEQAGGIVGVRPCGRGEGKGDKAGAGEHRSLLCAFPRSISGRARTFGF